MSAVSASPLQVELRRAREWRSVEICRRGRRRAATARRGTCRQRRAASPRPAATARRNAGSPRSGPAAARARSRRRGRGSRRLAGIARRGRSRRSPARRPSASRADRLAEHDGDATKASQPKVAVFQMCGAPAAGARGEIRLHRRALPIRSLFMPNGASPRRVRAPMEGPGILALGLTPGSGVVRTDPRRLSGSAAGELASSVRAVSPRLEARPCARRAGRVGGPGRRGPGHSSDGGRRGRCAGRGRLGARLVLRAAEQLGEALLLLARGRVASQVHEATAASGSSTSSTPPGRRSGAGARCAA